MSKARNVPQRVATARSAVAVLARKGAEPAQIEAARAELRVANATAAVERIVSTAPPLSAEQRARLAVLLLAPTGGAA
jgi:hypothetical protein